MICWACQTKMICVDSRPRPGSKDRKRRYKCPKCGEVTHTIEKILAWQEVEKMEREDRYKSTDEREDKYVRAKTDT